MAWWDQIPPHSVRQVVLLQVDIAGHSRWVEATAGRFPTARARAEFAVLLQNPLASLKFDRLVWLGDGGLFARKYDDRSDADAVCAAADEVFEVFKRWRRAVRGDLQLRVSACYIPDIDVHPEPGNWCSSRLNAFLKHERKFAHIEAFTITNDLLKAMSPGATSQKRFTKNFTVIIPGGEMVVAWVDRKHPIRVAKSAGRFGEWIRRQAVSGELPIERVSALGGLYQVGGSLLLESALGVAGFERIELSGADNMHAQPEIERQDRATWNKERTKLRKLLGTLLSVARVCGELTDDPVLRLWWRPVAFSDVRAFQILSERPTIRDRYLKKALMVNQEKGTSMPNSLCHHVLVLVRDPKKGDGICIAHRKKAARPGAPLKNQWSFGIEENFRPTARRFRNQDMKPDITVEGVVARALKEELVGEDYNKPIQVSVHAFLLETLLYPNFGLLAIAELPETTFDELKELWPNAPDHDENDAIAALPLDSEVIRECIRGARLPQELWSSMNKSVKRDLGPDDHAWHPTSKMRMALALWHLENKKTTNGAPTK